MTAPDEPVRLRFRGRMRRLPVMSFAAAFGRDVDDTARALETLIQGPPESALPSLPSLPFPGEGGKGGGERSGTMNDKERSERERSPLSERDRAHHFATALDDVQNFAAILTLVRSYPEPLLVEALRRTLAVPRERIRGTKGALFTGIVRRLARDGFRPPDS